jgi:bifunctional non-homologous end joining protein LigD
MKEASVHLKFIQGSANKVYNAYLAEKDDGWVVNFAYGRAGKPLRTGTKTAKPVSFEVAEKAYNKLVQGKKSKGYTEDEGGMPFTGSEKAGEATNWLPQLLNPVELEDVPEATKGWPSMWCQTKHDGERRGIIITADDIVPANRRGLRTTMHPAVQDELEDLAAALVGDYTLDCEDMGTSLIIFDVLLDGLDGAQFYERVESLWVVAATIAKLGLTRIAVDIPTEIKNPTQLEKFRAKAKRDNEEGIVIRNGGARYAVGRPNKWGDCLKYKFYASATCIVASVHATKRSVKLALWDGDQRVGVGNCTIPPNYLMPQSNDLVEVKYLYAYRGGSIYQPQYKGVRTDLDNSAATLDQLKYKAGT